MDFQRPAGKLAAGYLGFLFTRRTYQWKNYVEYSPVHHLGVLAPSTSCESNVYFKIVILLTVFRIKDTGTSPALGILQPSGRCSSITTTTTKSNPSAVMISPLALFVTQISQNHDKHSAQALLTKRNGCEMPLWEIYRVTSMAVAADRRPPTATEDDSYPVSPRRRYENLQFHL